MAATRQMWLGAVFLPALMFVGTNMCVWEAPRFLGNVALLSLQATLLIIFLVPVALPASLWFAVSGIYYLKKREELIRRFSKSLACACFIGLWLWAFLSALTMRRQAFVQTSFVGDQVIQALAQYRTDHGEYPKSLDELVPGYLNAVPYTGMIGYPEFTYRKDYNDMEKKPGEYELRIDCMSGGINFDRFIYWPSEKYPDRIQGNGVERIRSWAYVHE